MLLILLIGLLYFASGVSACGCTQDTPDDAPISKSGSMSLDLHGRHGQVPMQNQHIDIPVFKDERGMSYFVNGRQDFHDEGLS